MIMFEFISERPNVEDWRHDLNISFQHLGIYRISHFKSTLYEELKKLNAILSEYEGVVPSLYYNNIDKPYWYKFEVRVNNAMQKFTAYVKYEVNADKKLTAEIYCTHLPSTDEFPIKGGAEWRTIVLTESEIENPGFVVAYIKNEFIRFESYRQIGRDITYAVMEE
jgi:hypothetical protein